MKTREVVRQLGPLLGSGVELLRVSREGLIAFSKPTGLRSHPNRRGGDRRSLLACPYDPGERCYFLGDGRAIERVYLINRLDAPTSGVLLAAISADIARKARAAFTERAVEKSYLALVKGSVKEVIKEWHDQLSVERWGTKLRARRTSGKGQFALTRVRVLEISKGAVACTLLGLQPITGRTHQLRAQCAERGLPIVGDATYGDFRFNRRAKELSGVSRLCLHSKSIRLSLDQEGRRPPFAVDTPVPVEFEHILRLRLDFSKPTQ